MKRIIILLLLLAISLPLFITPSYGLSLPDDYVVPKINTLEEYLEWVKLNPPVNGVTWDKFSVLGQFVCWAFDSTTYLYQYGKRTYYLTIIDLSVVYKYENAEDFEEKKYWESFLPVIDQMTIKEFEEIKYNAPNKHTDIIWEDVSSIEGSDLTGRPIKKDWYLVASPNDNLLFKYYRNGYLRSVSWIHNGLRYELSCEDEDGEREVFDRFNETDIDIVRRLTNLETCEEALNELMSEISDNAVAEMPKGMPRDELTGGSNDGSGENSGGDTTAPGGDTTAPGDDTTAPGGDTTDTDENAIGSDENEENKDSKTESVLSWVFLGAAGVLVLATALGILLHSRKKK